MPSWPVEPIDVLPPMSAIRFSVALSIIAMPAFAEVVTDGTVGPVARFTGDFEIDAGLGRQAGPNLFHSFERFSLATGERATFSGPDDIRNVISRVTGGEPSDIDGTLRSTIAGADFYFINPAGVLFGPNARLDLQGSFHLSTADELRFADGATFSASNPTASSLTVAAPEAFGFLGPSPAPILVDRSTLAVGAGEALSLVGGDIIIDGGDGAASGGEQGLVRADAGRITLAAAGGPGEVRLDGAAIAGEAAAITLVDQALVDASGDGGGTIRIRGGAFLVDDAAVVADNTGDRAGAGGLDVRASVADVQGGRLTADARAGGPAGSVKLVADRLTISDGGRIDSNAFGAGAGGSITLDVERLELLRDGARVAAVAFGAGRAGDLTVKAHEILAVGADPATRNPSGLFSSSVGADPDAGNGGSIVLNVGRLELRDGAQVAAITRGPGAAGNLTVNARHVIAAGPQAGSGIPSGLFANSLGAGPDPGDGGSVVLNVDRLELLGGGQVFAGTFGPGDGGDVMVNSRVIVAAGADAATGFPSGIFAGSQGAGDAGNARVSGDRITLRDGAQISSSSLLESTGAGGEVRVTANDRLLIAGQGGGFPSGIFASAQGADGATEDAGDVTVSAGVIEIRDGGVIDSSTFTAGNAGTVEVTADALTVRDGARIRSGSFAAGDAGNLSVSADRLMLLDGGQISSSPLEESTGAGGEVRITANDRLLIAGQGGDFPSGIFASAEGAEGATEDAGDLTVTAGVLEIRDGGLLSSATFTAGNAGKVTVDADRIEFINDGRIFNGTNGAGNGGDIVVRAKSIFADVGSNPTPFHTGISASANPMSGGKGGDVTVTAGRIRLINGAEISSDTDSSGAAGTVIVSAQQIELRHGGQIFTTSSGGGAAGSIAISAGRIDMDEGRIATDTASTGGGEIRLSVDDVLVLQDSAVTTSVTGGADPTAGNITIDPEILVIDHSRIQADARTGNGGQVRIQADNILVPGGDFQALLDRGDISATGGPAGVDGTIAVNAPEVDLSGGLAVLDARVLDVSSLLRQRCAARRDIGASSFTGVGRAGLPPSPDGPLAGGYLGAEVAPAATGSALPAAGPPSALALPCTPRS